MPLVYLTRLLRLGPGGSILFPGCGSPHHSLSLNLAALYCRSLSGRSQKYGKRALQYNSNVKLSLHNRGFSASRKSFCQKGWHFKSVDPFGKFTLRNTPEKVKACYNIQPVNAQENPSQDEAIVKVDGLHDSHIDSNLQCLHQGQGIVLEWKEFIEEDKTELNSLPQIQVTLPIKYNMNIQLQGESSLAVDTFENNDISIEMEQGECRLKNIKTEYIQVHSDRGSVISEDLLQGNTFIQTQSGDVSIQKPVGQTLTVQTDEGNITIQSLYADTSNLSTHCGCIEIHNLHRNATINVAYQGNVKIGSMDGTLHVTVKEGDIDVQVTRHEWVNLTTHKGDIVVRTPRELNSTIDLTGSTVSCHDDLTIEDSTSSMEGNLLALKGRLLGDDVKGEAAVGHIVARSYNGSVALQCGDWLGSLGLKFYPEQ